MERLPQRLSFDDFLGLESRDFSRTSLIVLHGRSGSGKSTAICFLLEQHPDFHGRDCVVIDEIAGLRDLVQWAPALWRRGTLVIASHLSPIWLRLLRPFTRTAVFHTDRDRAKIARYLGARGVEASPAAVEAFVRRFGATYTDVELILERCPGRSFDRALAHFQKFCHLRLSDSGRCELS